MKNTITLRPPRGHLITHCLLLGIALVITSQATVTISSSFNLDSGTNLYTYSYSVENIGLENLALVSFPASAAANAFGISQLAGFVSTFDPFLGFFRQFENNDHFTDQSFVVGSITSPFHFTSALAPGKAT